AEGRDLVVVCAGERGRRSLEDHVCAGLLVEGVRVLTPGVSASPAALEALAEGRRYGRGVTRLAVDSPWARKLEASGRGADVTALGTLLDPIADKLLVAAALVSLLAIDKLAAWIVVVIVGRELAVTGLRAVAASVGVIVPASRLAKWKTVSQYAAITMLIVEKGFAPPGFHVAAALVLWVALGLTVTSAVDYFYRFFRKADYRAIVPGEERWS